MFNEHVSVVQHYSHDLGCIYKGARGTESPAQTLRSSTDQNRGSQGNILKMMSIYRLNVLLALVLAIPIVLPQMANGQSDVYQYGQKRTSSITTKYCGKHLSNALQLLCNGVYNSMFKKSGQEMEMDDYPYNYDEAYPLRSRASTNAMMGRFAGVRFRRQSRGVHDECCVKSCSVSELTSYCGR